MVTFKDIVPYMDNVRRQLTEVLNSFGPDEKQLREKPDGWNVTEVVEHLAKLEGMILYQLKQVVGQTPAGPSEPLDEKATDVMGILQASGIIGRKIEAPDPARPTGASSYEEALQMLDEVRAATKALIPKLAERNTNDLLFPHPAGFEMNAAQWAHFIAIHETVHVNQLKRIRAANRR
ncbi:DinB family protein [Paenibacillus chitinolyticus]|uniref:DinB family protein n=1 Tax=Paenibacillus chitinolyticus TaxID=79263 RepID=A0A410X1F2_9BACL|nr:DinB family protein [Paenibacillus chitinolyticus]MCY9592523.1 DinB family protein [Paenibacillus chitinolyticus]MCY9594874.1 DinB family protein [Paenibacillus chitinolyticus]QAV20442.1 DinB family protein [Paenibacillus chitinolyticus]